MKMKTVNPEIAGPQGITTGGAHIEVMMAHPDSGEMKGEMIGSVDEVEVEDLVEVIGVVTDEIGGVTGIAMIETIVTGIDIGMSETGEMREIPREKISEKEVEIKIVKLIGIVSVIEAEMNVSLREITSEIGGGGIRVERNAESVIDQVDGVMQKLCFLLNNQTQVMMLVRKFLKVLKLLIS